MNTRVLIVVGSMMAIVIIGIIVINITYEQYGWKEQVGGLEETETTNDNISTIPSAKEFLEMECDELEHIFQEFPDKETADAWNTRMHECINEQENIAPLTIQPRDKETSNEMENLKKMSCDEIIQRNTEGQYLSSDNRKFAREKVLDCSDTEESFVINASCEDLYERYHSGEKYWFEMHKTQTENRLAKCSEMMENEN